MPVKFSPSINIIRDTDRQFRYVVTQNASNTIQQVIDDFHFGFHSNIIIGSYGTGKSALLKAFEQSLKGESKYFNVSSLKVKPSAVKFIRFIGEYESIIQSFADHFGIKKVSSGHQQIFDAIFQEYEEVRKNGILVIFIDEFGKFLEYASQNQVEKELYFIQQLAEFVNDPDRNIFLITTLHQNFEAYSSRLDVNQRNEWKKVKGRFKEITFNEPVEQLLALASSVINSTPDKKQIKKIQELNKIFTQNSLFKINRDFINQISSKLFPLDFITGCCATRALQEYGQNERSLFTFIESRDFHNLIRDNRIANLSWLYDYLFLNFYSFLNSKHNVHFNGWSDIKDCIERAETVLVKHVEEAIAIIKTIGLLSIFTNKGAKINEEFLISYSATALDVSSVPEILKQLSAHKIIKYSRFNDSFRLFQGTDVDIDKALNDEDKKVEKIRDVALSLNKHFGAMPGVTAKEVTYKTGTTRTFKFDISEIPKILKATDEIDGYINLVISEHISEIQLKEHSSKDREANLYGLFGNSKKIKFHLHEIEKAQNVKMKNTDDKIVQKEMEIIINSNKNLLHHYFIDEIYSDSVTWFYNGKKLKISNKRMFNQALSEIAAKIYPLTPVFKNELVNRHKISSSIHTARKDFFNHLVNNWSEPKLSYDDNFPPDKTIYISLLLENGIHKAIKGGFGLYGPSNQSSFAPVWEACDEFLRSTKHGKRPISELYDLLLSKPYKLKLGLAEFLIPTYLFVRRDDYALFGKNGFIPEMNETTLLLFARNAEEYMIKAFDLDGVKIDLFNKYRELLKLKPELNPTNEDFIHSIKPFMTFYRQLPEYSKFTKKGLSSEARAVRDAIINSTDPEKTFFEDFPGALHHTTNELIKSKKALQEYAEQLKSVINEIRSAHDELINRFEKFICIDIVGTEMDFQEYQELLQKRFKNIKDHLLLNYHKSFLMRVNSPLDDKKSWLSSVAQSLIGKSLETIKDDEENILKDKFRTIVHELDNFVEVSAIKADSAREKVFKFEVTGEKMVHKTFVKIPKTKYLELDNIEQQIKKILKKDRQLNIAVLTKIIEEQLRNE
ncbi:MAG TPA: ATP-binding protein [Bacteroidia bacterium]|nr:ATP-binding protein [Bacteroidia bacterium]